MAELGWLGILVPGALRRPRPGARGNGDRRAGARAHARAGAAHGVRRAGDDRPRARRERRAEGDELPRLAAGEALAALAWQEEPGGLDPESVRVRATPFEGGYKLSGTKRFVAGAAQADAFLVSARTARRASRSVAAAGHGGRALTLEPLADGRSSGTLTLTDALVPRAQRGRARRAAAARALGRALDHARAIAAAELVRRDGPGARDDPRLSADTRAVRQADRQLPGAAASRGGPAHPARSSPRPCWRKRSPGSTATPTAPARAALASRVKARCADAAVKITRETIQLHGAHRVHRRVRRGPLSQARAHTGGVARQCARTPPALRARLARV